MSDDTTPAPTLYRNGRVHTGDVADATALVVDGPTVAWLGGEAAADALGIGAERTVDLDGALLAPAFVDAHVHCFDTGLHLTGVDLTRVTSVVALLDAVAATARRDGPAPAVLGHGWDEANLAEGRPPTAEELDRAAGGGRVYLSRVDVHSAVVSAALARAAGLNALPGWDPSGRVERDAHHAARAAARDLTPQARSRAHAGALRSAAAAGIATVHEMAGPDLAGRQDLPVLLVTAEEVGVAVVVYWGEAVEEDGDVREVLASAGVPPERLIGLAGDLYADGSIGSRTAAFREPYADAATSGRAYLDAAAVAVHVTACAAAGVQPGFHVIGDAALDVIVEGLHRVAQTGGPQVVRQAGIRLEHALATDDAAIAALVRYGVTASVQPAFSATWGGTEGTYRRRLGVARARALHRFGSLAAAGVPLAFGSDSPVTRFDPWGAVLAATAHEDPGERLSAVTAFAAHTRGAHRAAGGPPRAGILTIGAEATFAVWSVHEFAVPTPDGSGATGNADPVPATPPMPALGPNRPRPVCLRTVRAGRLVHDAGVLPRTT
jgi:hypothetical protein